VKDWFQFFAREYDVPCVGIHTPRSIGAVDEPLVHYVSCQIESMIPLLKEVAGQKLDIDRLQEIVAISKQTTTLWKAVLETAANRPSPFTFFDGTVQMGPAVVMRGLKEAVEYYQVLLPELQKRVADGVAAVPNERLRVYWEGMPVWGKLSSLGGQFAQLGACVVASTYCNSWIFEDLEPTNPFRSMARAYSSIFICRSDDRKEAYIEQMVKRFHVDGILYHDSKTCPNNSNSRYGMPQRLQKKLGKPYLVVNGDLNDLRLYSEEQTRTNIEAFVEQLMQSA
jgi:benzoyl-CoA reductase/2-hydroxyglutaryl-CoA dehydratase subunit BcrC/BadD/HgdB